MRKRILPIAIGAIVLIAAVFFVFRARIGDRFKAAQVADKTIPTRDAVSTHYQLWSVKLTGENKLDHCDGKFEISGTLDILFPADFAKPLADKAVNNDTIKGTGEFSSSITVNDNPSKQSKAIPLASRTIAVPSDVQVSWVTMAGKRQMRLAVTASDHKELLVSNCKINGNATPASIFTLILTGQPDASGTGQAQPKGIRGEWVTVNDNAPDDHSHGEFRMELMAGANSPNPISVPKNLQLQFARDTAHLRWKALPTVKSYKIYVSQGSQLDKKTATQKLMDTNFIDVSGLAKHTPYTFAVSALVGEYESDISESVVGVIGEPLIASKVAVGENHVCAIVAGGEIICWGGNKSGQLGNSQIATRGIAVPVPKITTAKAISAGLNFTCAVLADGHVTCWGSNNKGELGIGQKPGAFGPVSIADITNAVDIRSQGNQTCATLADESVRCWGEGITAGPLSPVLHVKRVVQTNTMACGLNTGKEVWCWSVKGSQPTRVLTGGEELAASNDVVCALKADHRIKCWREVTSKRTDKSESDLAAAAEKLEGVSHLSINNTFACATKLDDSVFCWGANDHEQLGVESLPLSKVPLASEITRNNPKGAIQLGADFACSLTADSQVYCWGSNEFGQLGNGVGYYSWTPQLVLK